ncbi:molybdopterin molybdotransferase MoeA [Paenibacillus sp. CMAA1364]
MSGRKHQQNFMRKAITVEAATDMVLASVHVMDKETVSIMNSMGRYLAIEVVAPQPVPHFRRAGMDGYAVLSSDTIHATFQNPIKLQVVDNIPAGKTSDRTLHSGECARIMTGASVPNGADAVIKYEMTTEGGLDSEGQESCHVMAAVHVGDNVSPIGIEMAEGETVLRQGVRIGPGEMALLAMFGLNNVEVFQQPRVAILTTGAELLEVQDALEPGRIRNSNGYMVAAMVKDYGGIPVMLDAIPDDTRLATVRVMEALASYDIVVTTGGVSVGDHDIMYDLTQEWDGDLKFNKLLMRPGSPTTFGLWQGKPLFALSGNPAACFVGSRLFLRPVIRGMMGAELAPEKRMTATLTMDYLKSDRSTRFVRGVISSKEGMLEATPVGYDMSSVTVSLRDANCLICIPGSPKGYEAGTLVEVILL